MFAAILAQVITLAPAWTYEETKAGFDDAATQLSVKLSDTDVVNVLGRGERAALALRCSGNKLAVILSWPGYIGRPEGFVYVKWRIDDGPIQETRVNQGSGSEGSLFLANKAHGPFLAGLASGKVLKVRVNGQTGDQDTTFALDGAPVDKFTACKSGH
jgi:hypothetical protein